MTFQRVGFACKYMDANQNQNVKILKKIQQHYSEKTISINWLLSQNKQVTEQKLWEIINHNTSAVLNLIEYTGNLIGEQRMVRIGSDQLPGYTHPEFQYFWRQSDVQTFLQKKFSQAGDLARKLDLRLSMHPGQFVVLASSIPEVVERSITEFEYHADMIRWMGYGQTFQDFKCNVHISGKNGPAGIKAILGRLSKEARNSITIENDEFSWGIEASLELEKELALVLDIHHHWIKNQEYIQIKDDRVKRIIDSWRGVRPVIHYSISSEKILINESTDMLPDIQLLLAKGFNKSQLRRHSDLMWNNACNSWAGTYRRDFDIMVEAKNKNLSSIPFERLTRNLNL